MRDITESFVGKIKDSYPIAKLRGETVRLHLWDRAIEGNYYQFHTEEDSFTIHEDYVECGLPFGEANGEVTNEVLDNFKTKIVSSQLDVFGGDTSIHSLGAVGPSGPKEYGNWNDGSMFYQEKKQETIISADTTDYLLSTEANRKNLEESIDNAEKGNVRTFSTGAIRDLDDNKEDYLECLSWTALHRYGMYMKSKEKVYGKGNWKKGIPVKESLKSALRHLQKEIANKYEGGSFELETDHVCAAFFNIMGILHEEERLKNEKK